MSGGREAPVHVVQLLGDRHDRARFTCGKEPLDRYLREQAGQDLRRHLASVFVVTQSAESPSILGYYTLTSSEVALTDLPAHMARRIPYPRVPATLLGRLARHVDAPRGLGSYMLIDAAARALSPGGPASLLMLVDPIDVEAEAWYERFGFRLLRPVPPRMFIPLETLRRVLGA